MSGPRPHPRSRAGAIVAAALATLLAACAGPGGPEAPRPIEEGIELRYRVDGARGDDEVLETFAVLARRCAAVGVERFRLSVYGEGRFGVILDAAEEPKLDRLKRVLGMQGDLRLQVVALEQ